jgi:geranylgeranyl diphosphate synthase type I
MTALPSEDVSGPERPDRPERRRAGAEDFVAATVGQRLDTYLAERCDVLLDVSPALAPVTDTLRGLARGGKRLRAIFCYWGWRGAGGHDESSVLDAAAALELFHLAALVHDDVMDHSDTRRGTATAHRRLAAHHRTQRLDGAADDFGVGAALLVGDLCLSWSDELLARTVAMSPQQAAARGVYDLMRSQVMAGQYLDMLEQARPGGRRDASARVLRFKSAKYTVEHPLQLGGALAGASDDLTTAYTRYGVPVGEAFQLRDDVLGVFGDPDVTGKPVGDDLLEGKKTLLVTEALARGDDVQRRLLQRRLGDRAMTAAHVRQLQDVLVDTGALDEIEQRITHLTEAGVDAISRSDVPPDVSAGLVGLARRMAGRTT